MSGPNGHTRRERMRHDIAAEEAAVEAEPLATPWGRSRSPRKSRHMRRTIIRILKLSPAERESYQPHNGFEEIALDLVNGKKGAVAVWREIKETLGERIGSNWKDTVEERAARGAPVIEWDLP